MHVFNPMIKGMGIIIEFLASYDKKVPIGINIENFRSEGKETKPLLSG